MLCGGRFARLQDHLHADWHVQSHGPVQAVPLQAGVVAETSADAFKPVLDQAVVASEGARDNVLRATDTRTDNAGRGGAENERGMSGVCMQEGADRARWASASVRCSVAQKLQKSPADIRTKCIITLRTMSVCSPRVSKTPLSQSPWQGSAAGAGAAPAVAAAAAAAATNAAAAPVGAPCAPPPPPPAPAALLPPQQSEQKTCGAPKVQTGSIAPSSSGRRMPMRSTTTVASDLLCGGGRK